MQRIAFLLALAAVLSLQRPARLQPALDGFERLGAELIALGSPPVCLATLQQ